jgi:hypothetical protein
VGPFVVPTEAHHRAFAAVNGADSEWPAWYAEYLAPRLGAAFQIDINVATLAAELAALDATLRAHAAGIDWAVYYAAWLMRRYRSRPPGG